MRRLVNNSLRNDRMCRCRAIDGGHRGSRCDAGAVPQLYRFISWNEAEPEYLFLIVSGALRVKRGGQHDIAVQCSGNRGNIKLSRPLFEAGFSFFHNPASTAAGQSAHALARRNPWTAPGVDDAAATLRCT